MSNPDSTTAKMGGVSKINKSSFVVTVEPVIICYMFASFLQFTAFQSMTYEKSCISLNNVTFCDAMENKTFQDDHEDQEDDIQTEASFWLMITNIAMAVPSIMSVFLFMGPWGDKVDRKLPLMIPCVGTFLYNLCCLLNAYFSTWPLSGLIPGLFVEGLAGGYITMMMASYSYVTNVSAEHDRTVRVAIIGAMIYLAGTVSVFISGLLVESVGHIIVFGICCGLTGIAFLYALIFLKSVVPEGKEEDNDEKSWCDTFVLSTVRETWKFLKKERDGNTKLLLILEIVTLNIVYMCTSGENSILYLYLKRSPRSFSRAEYGYYKGSHNLSRTIALLTLLPLCKKKLHMRDTTIALIGLFFRIVTSVMLGLAENMVTVFLAAIPALLQGFPSTGLRASMANRVDVSEHGRLFAVVAASESCVALATPFIFNGWYPSTLDYYDGTCFMFSGGIMLLAMGILFYVHTHSKEKVTSNRSPTSSDGEVNADPTNISLTQETTVEFTQATPVELTNGKSIGVRNDERESVLDNVHDDANGVNLIRFSKLNQREHMQHTIAT